MSEIVICAKNLVKSWRGRKVLDNVSLDLKSGTVTAVLGPSGTGKSTLLRVIAGLENVDAGQVENASEILTDGQVRVPPERRNIGLVFQDFSLFPHMTAIENVLFGLCDGSGARQRERALDQLASVQMADKARAYPHTLSGGEQQRVALARALAPQPDIVLLDEAFSGLDSELRVELRDTALRALRQSGAAVLVVTHDAEEAMYMADHLALMVDGAFIQTGAPDSVYLRPASHAAARLLGDVNSWTGKVEGGQLSSPVGPVDAASFGDGEVAVLMVRPEGLSVKRDPDGVFEVQESHALGANAAMTLHGPGDLCWTAKLPLAERLQPGEKCNISLVPELTTIVSAKP